MRSANPSLSPRPYRRRVWHPPRLRRHQNLFLAPESAHRVSTLYPSRSYPCPLTFSRHNPQGPDHSNDVLEAITHHEEPEVDDVTTEDAQPAPPAPPELSEHAPLPPVQETALPPAVSDVQPESDISEIKLPSNTAEKVIDAQTAPNPAPSELVKPKRRRSKRSSSKGGPVEHILHAYVEQAPEGSSRPTHPITTVGAPRARSNTVIAQPGTGHLSVAGAKSRSSSRPAAMRATASRVHAQLAAAGGGPSATGAVDEGDTDGEFSWAWDELNRQLDEEEDRKRKAYASQRPAADGSVNLDAWWIAFEVAWDANMLKGRGIRTWWDMEKYWPLSEVFGTDSRDSAEPPLEPTEPAEPVHEAMGAPSKAHGKSVDMAESEVRANGEETLVSSPEHSPRRTDSRTSLKTLAAPGTNQSKRASAPKPQADAESLPTRSKDIPEESAGHTTPTSLSSSPSSLSPSLGSPSRPDPAEPDHKAASEPQPPPQPAPQAEPVLRSLNFKSMWEEAERRWAEEEKAATNSTVNTAAGSGASDTSAGKKTSPAKSSASATGASPTYEPKQRPPLLRTQSLAEGRERARGLAREERASSRANSRLGSRDGAGKPTSVRAETDGASSAANHGRHRAQKEQEQFNVYAQSASAAAAAKERPPMSSRRQTEPVVNAVPGVGRDDTVRGRQNRGRNSRPKLHVDTDFTDYTQSAPRIRVQRPQAVPSMSQPKPRSQPPPQARPVPRPTHQPREHSQARPHSQSYSQTKAQPKPQAKANPPPPLVLRPVPVSSDDKMSRIAIAWRAYEARWQSMLAPLNQERITFANVPWPILHPPPAYADGKGLASLTTLAIAQFLLSPDHSPGIPARDRLRGGIRRWHSDKFNRFAVRMRAADDNGEDEKEHIMEGVGVVARALTQLLELERGD